MEPEEGWEKFFSSEEFDYHVDWDIECELRLFAQFIYEAENAMLETLELVDEPLCVDISVEMENEGSQSLLDNNDHGKLVFQLLELKSNYIVTHSTFKMTCIVKKVPE